MPDSSSHPRLGPELRITIGRLARRIRSQRAREDLSDSQMSVLFVLDINGALTLGALSEHERVTPPSMNRTVNGLEAAGLLARSASPDDGRKVMIEATAAGLALVADVRRRRDAWFAQRLEALTPEQRALLIAAEPVLRELAEQ